MAYYFILNITITNNIEYDKYLRDCDDVFKKYRGKYLAVDNNPEVIEGKSGQQRVVIIKFDSKNDFDAWYYSIEYQEILKHRLKGAECNSILVEGDE